MIKAFQDIFCNTVILHIGEGRGAKVSHMYIYTYIHTYIHTHKHTYIHTDPLTKRVVEELSLLKNDAIPFGTL